MTSSSLFEQRSESSSNLSAKSTNPSSVDGDNKSDNEAPLSSSASSLFSN